jgi:hypothetical protein
MPEKPVVQVTRKLPDEVEDRLRRTYAVRLNPTDKPYSAEERITQVDSRYRGIGNVFLLPYFGSSTREARIAMGNRAIENIDAIIAGKAPADRVA